MQATYMISIMCVGGIFVLFGEYLAG